MKRMKKACTLILASIITASIVPSNMLISYAAENSTSITNESIDTKSEGTTIKVKKAWGNPGKQTSIVLSMENNPGIVGLTLQITYDDTVISLAKSENGTAINGENITFTPPASGSNFVWSGTSVKSDEVSDGTLLTLTFDVNENAKLGEYPITVSCINAVDNNLNKVPIKIDSSSFSIIDYVPGDTSGDGDLAMNDLVLLVRYIADGGYNEKGYAAKVNTAACDVDGDGDITVIDAVLLSRYIADNGWNPNGYNVELQPAPFQCSHASLKHIEAVEAESCQKSGNIEYWHCDDCDKYYSDEQCNNEITKEDTIVKGEHTVVIDEAVAPTADKNGLTEGSHCSVCGEILTKQEVVPKLKQEGDYSITYNVVGSDTYLASLNIQNPNRKYYSSGDVFRLDDLEVPGYTFEGWYDGQGKTANKVTSIKADDAGNLKLYAHWSVIEYHIDFDTDKTLNNPDIPSMTYTVDRGATLPNMSLNGYYFMGWADENDKSVKSIPKGTFGNKTLYPIWTSHRNSTHPNDYLKEGAAAITEWDDDDGNTNISFVYNIGKIENVPIYQIGEWMNSSGIKQTKVETVSDSFSKECAENFVKAVSNATTNSSSWTLSSQWSETLEEDKSLIKNVTEEQIAASQNYYENTGSVCIGSGNGLSGTVSSSDGTSSKVVNSSKQNVGTDVEIEARAGTKNNYIAGKTSLSVNDEWSNSSENGETHNETQSASGYWNTDESHSESSTAGGSSSFSKAISNSLSSSERYGRMVTNSIGDSQTNTSEHYQSSSDSYSNTFVYSTNEETCTTIEIELDNAPDGFYRRALVGTAYVFAVVNYNFATEQFFVNTYSIMDKQSYNAFWDYSPSTTSFTDHQNGVLPFSVPFEVNEYIGSLTTKTSGLTVDKETGIINGYTGTDTGVIIPEYISYDNADKTHTSIKVTGIAPDAFAGNKDIVAVYLPDSITEIPAGAFKDCTSLKKVEGKNIKSIGTKAFQNCTSLKEYTVNSSVTKLGNKAFDKVNNVIINAANADIVSAATESGANSITLNLKDCSDALTDKKLNIPNTTEYFKLEGAGKTLNNVQILSDAKATEIQNVIMNNTIGRPLVTSSETLTIGSAKITAPSLAIVLLSEKTNVTAYGQSSIISNGEYALLSHDVTYSGIDGSDIAKLNITGNSGVCGKVDGEKYLNFTKGKIIKIDEDEFDRLINNMFTLSFDANGGTVDKDSMQAYSEVAIGKLPVPTKTGNIFTGWYTKDDTKITETTVFKEAKDTILYAKWVAIALNKSELTLNTDGSSKTYQLTSTYSNPDAIVWASSDPTIATVTQKGVVTGLKDGTATITATVNGASVSCKVTVKTAYNEKWSDWSDWSTNKVTASDTVEVKTENRSSKVLVSYTMDSYCTVALDPWRRQFRNYSVNGDYAGYGLSTTYGEHHNTWTYTVGEVNAARVIPIGEQQGGGQNGTNMGTVNGYAMVYGGEDYIFYITSENYENVTTTYYSSRTLIKTPVVYTN